MVYEFGKERGEVQRRFSQFKRLRTELRDKYQNTFIPVLREDKDVTDENMKVRIHILTVFLSKLLGNRELMDTKTRLPVQEIQEFFKNTKDVGKN